MNIRRRQDWKKTQVFNKLFKKTNSTALAVGSCQPPAIELSRWLQFVSTTARRVSDKIPTRQNTNRERQLQTSKK